MSKRFLVTNALMFIQNHYAEQLFRKVGEVTIDGETARVIETLNCDNYTQIGTPGSQESYLFDLDGIFYVVPESWAKEKILRITDSITSPSFTFVEAENIIDLAVTATSDERPAA
ncbi:MULTISPECIES: hypothetical protein [Acinetobacter]|uniref:Uncharacterized protein n=1 Tax=Acinetobacter indicus TaxID=756892 RepID=A0A6C0Y733_9GAMM|nr:MULTISPECIES: hypothetical protein [Acinetobacter]QIC71919.1 hypothetical protein FSC09_16135 [Acinetobacter indicus]QKQ71456.1 hypothetical protein E5Y90_14590 [Acinetobacter sp. 10FS3-1]